MFSRVKIEWIGPFSLSRARYDFFCCPTVYFVNQSVDVIMFVHFPTHKTFINLNLVKIVFIGHLENRIVGGISH